MEALILALSDHPFLRELQPDQVENIAACAREVAFPAGAVIFREGRPASSLYLLRSGRVALEINVPPRGAVRVETLAGGDILGLSWLFAPYRWQTDAHAVEPVIAIAIDAPCLRAKLDEDPALGHAVTRSLAHKLYERLERVRLQRLDVYKAEP
jgi:CRP-like cAMP-binding protein